MNKLMLVVVTIIGFTVSETLFAIAQKKPMNSNVNQSNSINLDKQKMVVTQLETNKTKTADAPVSNISGEDFWKVFGPLLEPSTNETIGPIK